MATKIKQRPATMWEKEPLIMTTERVAIILGVSPVVVRLMAREGRIPAKKLGPRKWYFEKNALREAICGKEVIT